MRVTFIKMTKESFDQMAADDVGVCMSCGAYSGGCPDKATRRPCEECGARSAHGVEALLIAGTLLIKGFKK